MSRPDGMYTFGYESDPDRLSPSGARKLLQSPARFAWDRTHPQEPKAAFDFGLVAHELILGVGDGYEVVYADNWTTKAAKEQRDTIRAAHKTPILEAQMAQAKVMADAVRAHPLAAELLADGQPELWLYATEPETRQGLRGRADWLTRFDGRACIVEFKTAASAEPAQFARKATDFGYHIAAAMLIRMAEILELDSQPVHLFIVAEKEPPHLVSVCELDADAFLLGCKHMQQAIDIYRKCTETGIWPGYGDGINSISLPPWAFKSNQPSNQPTIGDLLLTEGIS